MTSIFLLFPTQLYKQTKCIETKNIYLIEEPIYFTDFKFHKLKLAYHRATMKYYYDYLKKKKYNVKYINFFDISHTFYKNINADKIYIYDPIEKKLLDKLIKMYKDRLIILPTQNFLVYSDIDIIKDIFPNNNYSFNKFYIYYRKKFDILLDKNKNPIGGKWSYDEYNRKKVPNGTELPDTPKIIKNKYINEATKYVNEYFKDNYGEINFIYPITHKESEQWLNNFLKNKMYNFGEYQDAILENNPFMFHSILTPMMNNGLLIDDYVITKVINFYEKNTVKIQNIEGFIRQIFWRNYMFSIYMIEQPDLKINNINNKLYYKLWEGTTNMFPIDSIIKTKILPYAYFHHIERLMIVGNYMKLCLLDSNLIYRMFMEWVIDSYNWVMFGNVYGMILNEIKIMKKNYIASSNYIFKMSDFKNEEWSNIFDAIYYNYIFINYSKLTSDYGLRYQIAYIKKMSSENKNKLIITAKKYLTDLNK